MSNSFPVLLPDLQISFNYRLKTIKDLYFHEALALTLSKLQISDIDNQLSSLVSAGSLNKLAQFSLRGEAIFPIPLLLIQNPFLLGYYRLLLGFSQKEFFSKGPFGKFKLMENKGIVTPKAINEIDALCKSLIKSAEIFVKEIDAFSLPLIQELQLLTVGPLFRGSMNNTYGQVATQKTFVIIKDMVKNYIVATTPTSIDIKNDSGRFVTIAFSPDPDIEITERFANGNRGLVSIEIKGGRDISNIHNRIGEAEKSHQKAKKRGHFEFITILNVDFDYSVLKSESPTTSHFYNLDSLSDKSTDEFSNFNDTLSSILSIHL